MRSSCTALMLTPNLIHFQFITEQRNAVNKGLEVRHRLRNYKVGRLGWEESLYLFYFSLLWFFNKKGYSTERNLYLISS